MKKNKSENYASYNIYNVTKTVSFEKNNEAIKTQKRKRNIFHRIFDNIKKRFKSVRITQNNEINFRFTLCQFVRRFVGHNIEIYVYKERIYKDKDGLRKHEYILLEDVMEWQIDHEGTGTAYWEAHPDIKKSQYSDCNVVKVINAFEDDFNERLDVIAVVIDISKINE